MNLVLVTKQHIAMSIQLYLHCLSIKKKMEQYNIKRLHTKKGTSISENETLDQQFHG